MKGRIREVTPIIWIFIIMGIIYTITIFLWGYYINALNSAKVFKGQEIDKLKWKIIRKFPKEFEDEEIVVDRLDSISLTLKFKDETFKLYSSLNRYKIVNIDENYFVYLYSPYFERGMKGIIFDKRKGKISEFIKTVVTDPEDEWDEVFYTVTLKLGIVSFQKLKDSKKIKNKFGYMVIPENTDYIKYEKYNVYFLKDKIIVEKNGKFRIYKIIKR